MCVCVCVFYVSVNVHLYESCTSEVMEISIYLVHIATLAYARITDIYIYI